MRRAYRADGVRRWSVGPPSLPSSLHSSIVKGAVPLATGTDDEWEWRGSLPSRSLPGRSTFPPESDASWMEGLGVSVASPFHRHSLSTPLATLTAVTRVTKERRKHDGVREEPSKPWAGENGTVKETTIPYLSHPHHMVTARDERNEQGPHVMGSGLMFPVPYAPGLTSGSTGFVDDREGNSINLLSSVGSSWSLRKLGSWTFNPYSFSEMGSASRSTSHGNWRVWQGHNHHVTDKRIMYGLQPSWVRRYDERTQPRTER